MLQAMIGPFGTVTKTSEPGLMARLRRALSADYMAARLAASRCGPLADAQLVGCEVVRVFPRGAKGFVIAYSLRLEKSGRESVETLYGEVAPGDPELHCWHARSQLGRDALSNSAANGPIASIPDPGIVVRSPGYDEALVGLRMLHNPMEVPQVLAACGVSLPGPGHELSAELLGHRLGKRAVVRLSRRAPQGEGSGPESLSVVAKLFKRGKNRARAGHDILQALRRDGLDGGEAIRVPRPLGYAADQAALFLEDIPGTPLHLLFQGDMPAGMALAGRALARLHRCRIDGPKSHGVGDEVALLEPWVQLIGQMRPELRSEIEAELAAVRIDLSRLRDGPMATIHRDFHPKQVFVDGETAIMIDFDTLGAGDPALDVGNFLAHLRLASLQSGEDTSVHAEDFLRGYGAAQSGDTAIRTAAYERSARLRLTCLYALSTRWGCLAQPLLRDFR